MHKNWKFSHISMVVRDMQKAIKRYETLGVGPFKPFIGGPGGIPVKGTVHGKEVDYDMDLRFAEGDMGGLRLELIQPLRGRTIYNEFLEKHGEGAHHVCYDVEDLDKEIADMASRGYQVTQTGTTGTVKWAYFDTDKDGSIVIELGQRVK